MLYLRRFLEIFLVIFVLAAAVPSQNWQDSNNDDGSSSQSDNSNDQQSDQAAALGDFLFEHPSILHTKFQHEISSLVVHELSAPPSSIQIPYAVPFLPHIFISECGLMPRAPAQA